MKLFFGFLFIFISNAIWCSDSLLVTSIEIEGNKRTKDFIIEREILFERGKSYSIDDTTQLLLQSKNNINNTNLFNFVRIKIQNTTVRIDVVERWYVWPSPVFQVEERNVAAWWDNGHNFNRATYGMNISHYNFRGRKEKLDLRLQLGYSKTIGLDYDVPFLWRDRNWGAHFSFSHITRHEIPYTSDNDKWVFLKLEELLVRQENMTYLELFYRQGFYVRHRFLVDFKDVQVHDSIPQLNSYYLGEERNRLQYFTLMYQYKRDKRDDKDFPLKGNYAELEAVRNGLGVFDNNLNITYIQGEWKHFIPLYKSLYFAYGLRGKISSPDFQPFYVERLLGRRELPRAYDHYVIGGQSYYVAKTNLRYKLFNIDKIQVPFIKDDKFGKIHIANYLSTFFDFGKVYDRTDYRNWNISNTQLYSYGVGFETVTYYDGVLRLEYSRNHLLESRFFIHFTTPI